jgi:hypothetical protein
MDDEPTAGRKLLREQGDVRMWQEYIAGPHHGTGQLLRYFVGRSNEPAQVFTTPHLAFEHFQKLSGAPTRKPGPPSPKRGTGQKPV